MSDWLPLLTRMARALSGRLSLEDALTVVVDHVAEVVDTGRASIRLLDPTRKHLFATARYGVPIHVATQEFAMGEGLVGWIVEHGEAIRTGDADADPRFVPRPGMKDRLGSFLGVPLMSGELSMGVISTVSPKPDYFTEEHERLVTLISAIAAPHIEIARLSRLSTVDPLTGALNRRGGDSMFPQASARDEDDAPQTGPLSVALADIDHFKRVNDALGHAVGDEVLKRVATILSGVLRDGDAVIRHGGEEFLVVLPGCRLETATRIADRARRAVEETEIAAGEAKTRVTISVGVAQLADGETREDLVARADAAMYEAKQAGRNKVAATE
jgi:diguanylate cyclase (GGDEF)-like protein